ncbi:MAG TPA: BTAD domain-containing putative transcriptional regulator [Gemmatimonadaceae bacterium]|nr:BTAD domain-containing putative transcriptional regulator [Gemmatimonadaceae bacterium]
MSEPGPTIRLRTLGALQLHNGAGEEAHALLSQPRRVALLVYLVMAAPRGFHRRDRLLALFWPEQDGTRARNALSQAVHFLRRALGGDAILSRGDDEIGVDQGRIWCDAIELEAALTAGRLDEALELYRGPFLDGVHISAAAPELEHWIDAERTRLGRRYAEALERMADARESAGDHVGAALWLRKLVAEDPLAAHPTLRLMRALAAAGDGAGAIRHARVHEAMVREELGAPVHPDVAALTRELQTTPPVEPIRAPIRAAPPPVAVAVAAAPAQPLVAKEADTDVPRRADTPRVSRRSTFVLAGFAVVGIGALLVSRAHRPATAQVPPISCLAVIPLENLSRDSTQEYFADGVTDAIITELARHERLTVISRTSVTRYKRSTKPLPTIARELGCDGIIEGTVSTSGDRVHVNAQLLYGPGDRHLWASGYDGQLKDVLALEREIADSIARQVHGVTTMPRRGLAPAVDPIAYGQYLRGRDAFRSRNPASIRHAVALYREAVARDSTFALGYAGLADGYRFLGGLGYAPRASLADSARLMAARALALDSTLSEAHASLAALLTDDADWSGAEREFRRAIVLEPGNALAHQWYAVMLATMGRKAEALTEIRRAEALDPLSQPVRGAKVDIERYAGVRDSSIVLKDRSRIVDPNNPGTIATLSINLARQGKCAEAYVENGRAQELAPGNTSMGISLVAVHMLCKHRKEARALLDTLERRPDARLMGIHFAELFAGNAPDSAFAWLGRTEWGMASRYQLRVSPRLAPLRSDPRYGQLLASMGLH